MPHSPEGMARGVNPEVIEAAMASYRAKLTSLPGEATTASPQPTRTSTTEAYRAWWTQQRAFYCPDNYTGPDRHERLERLTFVERRMTGLLALFRDLDELKHGPTLTFGLSSSAPTSPDVALIRLQLIAASLLAGQEPPTFN